MSKTSLYFGLNKPDGGKVTSNFILGSIIVLLWFIADLLIGGLTWTQLM